MNNEDELLKKFKQRIAIYNYEEEITSNKRTILYPLKKDTIEWRNYIMKKKILQIFATFIIIFISGITVYAGVKGNLNFKNAGLLKVSENFEENKVGINGTIENEYVKIVFKDIARDSAYLIVEYDIFPKEKAIEEMGKIEYDATLGYMIGIAGKQWINDQVPDKVETTIEKISDEEYKCSVIINVMNYPESTLHLNLWLNNFYIGSYTDKKGIKINKMIEMDVTLDNISEIANRQEQKIDKNTKVILDEIKNSSFETYIKLKRITENITWEKYNNIIEYYRFKVTSSENNSISSICHNLGKKVFKNNKLIKDYSVLKDNDIVRVEESYSIVLGAQTNFGKIKILQTKSTFFSDRTNEEKVAYYKAKWYPLKEGEKKYKATNKNGGVFEINKITIDDEKIVFYYNKSGIFGETSFVDLRVNDGTMNYVCPTKNEIKSLTSDENKITFNRDVWLSAGLNVKEGMLDDLSKVEFTLLFGDVDEIIGEPLIVEVPEQTKQKTKMDAIKINDTIAEKYVFNGYWTEIDSYDGKTLNYFNHQILPLFGNIKANEDSKKLKDEIENFLKKENAEYKVVELKSGEYVNLR